MTQKDLRIRQLERDIENAEAKNKANEEFMKILVSQVLEWQWVARHLMSEDDYDKECERIDIESGLKKALKID